MFDLDKWQEILATIRSNKLRTALTAFGVFWGVLMLLFLLGAGSGLQNGVNQNMTGFATNAVYIWGRTTTIPHAGMPPGRQVRYDNRDYNAIQREITGIEHLSPRNQLGGFRGGNVIARGTKTGSFSVYGDYPQFIHVQPMIIEEGRFINDIDIRDSRKVVVIGSPVQELLFEPEEDPIGQSIKINGVYFQVIGTFRSKQKGEAGDRQSQAVYVPFVTFQRAFNFGDRVGWFAITAEPGVDAEVLEKDVRGLMARRHKIDPEDEGAIGSFNAKKQFSKTQSLFLGIRGLVWFVGVMTLLAGIIGVVNIMLIVVKERTKEIGVRKAMGATPFSIVTTFIQESVVLTTMAGYLGIVAGVGVVELMRAGIEADTFANPTIELSTALIATAILIVAGAVAGIVPAWMAARVDPVHALRSE